MSIIKKTSLIWVDLLNSINSAQTEILFQTFYLDNDITWQPFAEALINKSLAGVQIRCLFDSLGCTGLSGSELETRMKTAGIKIIYFNWLSPWSTKNKKIWFFRNHKRSLIIDKHILHVGGWCIGDKTKDWLDANMTTEDTASITAAIADFENMYIFAHKAGLNMRDEKRFVYTRSDIQAYGYQAPLPRSRYIAYNYLTLLRNAKKEIILGVPYFVPTHRFTRALCRARRRGVAVTLFLPQKTDHNIVDIGARTYFDQLLRYGIQIYLGDQMLHAKASVIDDVAFIGSFNLDPISIRFNFENGIFTQDPVIVHELYADFAELKQRFTQVSYEEWSNRSVWKIWIEKFVRLFRGIL